MPTALAFSEPRRNWSGQAKRGATGVYYQEQARAISISAVRASVFVLYFPRERDAASVNMLGINDIFKNSNIELA
jgi:hypothetical protein